MDIRHMQCDICKRVAASHDEQLALWGKLHDAFGSVHDVCTECLQHLEQRRPS